MRPEDAVSWGKKGGRKEVVRGGVGFGSALAIAISWSQHQSILLAIIHGVFSWFYVIYYAFTR
jgi:hypothetical protein